MKIVILSDDFPPKSGGGAAIIAHIHATTLVSKGYDVTVVTTVENKKDVGEVKIDGLKVIKIYSKYHPRFRSYISLYNPFIISKISKILKTENADIVHAHNIHSHISYHALSVAKKYSKALFVTIHDSMPFHYSKLFPQYPYHFDTKSYAVSWKTQLKDFGIRFNPFRNIAIRYYLGKPNKIMAVSEALKRALNDNEIMNVEVVNNGIDIKKWEINSESVNNFKKKYNLINKKIILFCGRLSRAKGGEVLIKSMPAILSKIPNAVLLIVGEKTPEVAGNDNYLVFTGKLSNKALIEAYGASNILVSPSLCFDWFPTVNLEAMAMKLPVITTCFGGGREAVKEGVTGYVINPYHSNELENKVVEVLKNDSLLQTLGLAGYERVQKEFNLENYANKIISCYNKFI